MFANLSRLVSREPAPGEEGFFVHEVRVRKPRVRSRPVERLLVVGWILIALKTAFLFWVVPRYHMPFNAWWVVAPTIIFAMLCTGVYFFRGK